MRLTKRTESGLAVLDKAAFPEYAQETLVQEMCAFSPWKKGWTSCAIMRMEMIKGAIKNTV